MLGDLVGHLIETGLCGLGHLVEVLHHGAGLFVELADAAVERGEILLELALAVFELLDDRACRGLDGGGEADIGFVGHPPDAEIQLVVAPLGLCRELRQALLDRREQRLDGLLALGAGGTFGGEFTLETLNFGRDLLAEPVQLLLDRVDDARSRGVGLIGHHTSFRGRTAESSRSENCRPGGAERGRRVVIGSGGVVVEWFA